MNFKEKALAARETYINTIIDKINAGKKISGKEFSALDMTISNLQANENFGVVTPFMEKTTSNLEKKFTVPNQGCCGW